ncbi:uncharacterized protein TRIVIDRAFT_65203 [Trichoderma virens Gv29-8]|uniref:Uncharacterized protein n=1 Tax=Hypocrea virens (strain Gv29-8 / FGSC 10586) TaxID=413071 RepID=G9NAW1_HYPVG|nr:uncharacterized protein TRIVIDRAFT_65203 [Trichoderma virens Gv29-8]EHK15972.1 hypothetical protein TRIVIDRAFT_65203 [Trichoderma virens Gv29-8]UKZ56254.1 hypothetical protein TrVGV298_010087 [Trichoderma virens]
MGPPKTRGLRARQSRSRFHEGSMNDRVSAVPPSQFLGPEELESLERPLEVELEQHQYNLRSSRRSQDTTRQLQLFMSRQAPSIAPSFAPSVAPSVAPSIAPSTATSPKKGVLGQVWEGVRGRFKLKKDPPSSPEQKKQPESPKKSPPGVFDDRPTREEALASYHLLVEAGFFTTHAIQSTRQPPPPGFLRQRPATSHQALSSVTTPPPKLTPLEAPPSLPPPPKWPLNSTPITPKSNRTSLSAVTPASADSRGTKRTANEGNTDIQIHQDEPPRSPRSARTRGKKIRKTASKDFGIPILRTARSRRKLKGTRASGRKSPANGSHTPVVIHHYHSTSSRDSRHSKRSSHLLCATSPSSSAASSPRNSFDSASSARESGESVYSVRAIGSGSKSSRGLRPRKVAPAATSAPAQDALKVVPNANRGIPIVPSIPAKYTFGEDRENGQPWRGLRR